MTTARQIGIAGLGLLGSALAHRLIQAGYSPKGYDIDPDKIAALAKAGGIAATLDEVAHCDVVMLAVFDTSQVEDVVTNAVLPALTGVPKIVLCASTCDPDRIAALSETVSAHGLTLVETPVSGSSAQVRNGDGVGLLGGNKDAIDGVADIVDALYPKWFYMGPVGNGGRAKLAINHMLGLNRLVLAEGLVFAQALGLDPAALLEVARQSAAYSQVMDIKGPKMVSRRLHAAGLHPPVAEGFQTDHRAGRQARTGDAARDAQRRGAGGLRLARRKRTRQRRGDRGDQETEKAIDLGLRWARRRRA